MSRVQFNLSTSKARLTNILIRFPTNGAAAPAAANVQSTEEVTITYGATGKYTCTFTRPMQDFFQVDAHLDMGTSNASYAQVDSASVSTNGVMVVVIGTYNSSGTATAIAAASNNYVGLEIVVRE